MKGSSDRGATPSILTTSTPFAEGAQPLDGTGTPQKLGRFVLLKPLGRGAMGTVWAAYDPDLEREVALKILHPSSEVGADSLRERWLREARALAKVSHPNIVAVYEVGRSGDDAYLTMELVQGRTLRGLSVPKGELESTVIEVYLQAAKGLAAAHAAGLVHRDFKPDNVLLGDDARVRVVDFGLARAATEADTALGPGEPGRGADQITQAGTVMGTPAYMAPELRRSGRIDARSDQFAFCVALFEALNGHRPAKGEVPTGRAAAVLARGLAKSPQDRWPSMDALQRALQASYRPSRWWGYGLAAVAAVGLTALVVLPGAAVDTACADARAVLDASWNDGRAARLDKHLHTMDEVDPRAYERVDEAFSKFVDGWGGHHKAVCGKTVNAERAAGLQCLVAQAHRLEALATALEEAPAKHLVHLDRVIDLPAAEDCVDPDRVRLRMPMPDDAVVRNEVQALRLAIAQAEVVAQLGDARRGLTAQEALVDRVDATNFEPLQAELQASLGRSYTNIADHRRARDAAHKAIAAAKRSGAPLVEARGWILLGLIDGYLDRQAEDGHRALEFAEAALVAAGGDAKLAVDIAAYRGHVFLGENDLESAHSAYRDAVELAREDDEGPARIGQILEWVGNVLRHQRKYDEAEQVLQESLGILTGHLGPEHPSVAAAWLALGNVSMGALRYDEAVRRYQRARRGLHGDILGRLLNNLAQAYIKLDHVDDAAGVLRDAIALYTDLGIRSIEAARTRSSLAWMLRLKGKYPEALAEVEAAIATAERSVGPEHHELARFYRRRASVHTAMGERELAIRDTQKALGLTQDDALRREIQKDLDTLRAPPESG